MLIADRILWVCLAFGFVFLWAMLIRSSVCRGGCGSISCKRENEDNDD